MKHRLWVALALGVLLAACAPVAAPPASEGAAATPVPDVETDMPLPDGPRAPEIQNDTWLNTAPLTAADLKGRVVLIDFWTFG